MPAGRDARIVAEGGGDESGEDNCLGLHCGRWSGSARVVISAPVIETVWRRTLLPLSPDP